MDPRTRRVRRGGNKCKIEKGRYYDQYYCSEHSETSCEMKLRVYFVQNKGFGTKKYYVTKGFNHDHTPKTSENNQNRFTGVKRKRQKIEDEFCDKSEVTCVDKERGSVEGGEERKVYFSLNLKDYMETYRSIIGSDKIRGPFFGKKEVEGHGNIDNVDRDFLNLLVKKGNVEQAAVTSTHSVQVITPPHDSGWVEVSLYFLDTYLRKINGYEYVDNKNRSTSQMNMNDFRLFSQEESEEPLGDDLGFNVGEGNNGDYDDNMEEYIDLDFDGSFLHYACGEGKIDVVRKLVEIDGLDPFKKDSMRITPLFVAEYFSHTEVLDYFRKLDPTMFSVIVGDSNLLRNSLTAKKNLLLPSKIEDYERYIDYALDYKGLSDDDLIFLEEELEESVDTEIEKFFFSQASNSKYISNSWILENDMNTDYYTLDSTNKLTHVRDCCKIKLKIEKRFEDFTKDDEQDVLRFVTESLGIEFSNAEVTDRKSGSTVLTILLYSFKKETITKLVKRINDPGDIIERRNWR